MSERHPDVAGPSPRVPGWSVYRHQACGAAPVGAPGSLTTALRLFQGADPTARNPQALLTLEESAVFILPTLFPSKPPPLPAPPARTPRTVSESGLLGFHKESESAPWSSAALFVLTPRQKRPLRQGQRAWLPFGMQKRKLRSTKGGSVHHPTTRAASWNVEGKLPGIDNQTVESGYLSV